MKLPKDLNLNINHQDFLEICRNVLLLNLKTPNLKYDNNQESFDQLAELSFHCYRLLLFITTISHKLELNLLDLNLSLLKQHLESHDNPEWSNYRLNRVHGEFFKAYLAKLEEEKNATNQEPNINSAYAEANS